MIAVKSHGRGFEFVIVVDEGDVIVSTFQSEYGVAVYYNTTFYGFLL